MNLAAAYASPFAVPVDFEAIVSSPPHFFTGTHTHRRHEAFEARCSAGPLEIVDNVDIAPPCPVRPGDRIEVRGVMVHPRNREPVVHWTHHDPAHRHRDGFIRLRGRSYA